MAQTVRRLGRAAIFAEKNARGSGWRKPALSLRKQALLRKKQWAALNASNIEPEGEVTNRNSVRLSLTLDEVAEFDESLRPTLLGWSRSRASIKSAPKGRNHTRKQAARAIEIAKNLEEMPEKIAAHKKSIRDAKPKSFLDKILNTQYSWERKD